MNKITFLSTLAGFLFAAAAALCIGALTLSLSHRYTDQATHHQHMLPTNIHYHHTP